MCDMHKSILNSALGIKMFLTVMLVQPDINVLVKVLLNDCWRSLQQ